MNLQKAIWIKYKANGLEISRNKKSQIITNNLDTPAFVVILSRFKTKNNFVKINFRGKIVSGRHSVLSVYSLRKKHLTDITFDSEALMETKPGRRYIFVLRIDANTSIKINDMDIENVESEESFFQDIKFEDFLIISPTYPSPENKYLSGFVHTRLKAYSKEGIKFSLVCAHDYGSICKYSYEDIEVLRVPFPVLRKILLKNRFKKIAVHFFDEKYASILDGSYLGGTKLYLWVHGPETLYWDWPYFTTPYFSKRKELTDEQASRFKENDTIINKYNNLKNVTWIFVSEWIKKRSEELTNIEFNNFKIIPNFVDERTFEYEVKRPDLRKEIFFVRRYDDVNKYAVDMNVRAILELSRRSFFKDLKFNIYGTGEVYDELLGPLKVFDNVILNKRFLTHEEIAQIHKENGVGFFPTRYDAQGVSMCEAAMSGLAIVSSDNDAIREFIPDLAGNLVDTENYKEYANIIEKLYKDPKFFKKLSSECHKKVSEKCSFVETINKEIMMFNEKEDNNKILISPEKVEVEKEKVLSVIVPSYNVEDFLELCIETLLNHKNRGKMEIIIVNDGSTDKTLEVARKIQGFWNVDGNDSTVRVIDKENGGHGSTINVGLQEVKGKFVRLVDADDWVDSSSLGDLIDILENEDSDLVLTNYSEDRVEENKLKEKDIYGFMTPGIKYNFEDLCLEDFGFGEWGPVLATSTFKTDVLRERKFSLTEKSPYVDMEFNMYSILNIKNIVYYDLDIYRYFIGRSGQSISEESFKRNYLKHRNIFFTMIRFVESATDISPIKKNYIINKLIIPMVSSHYVIMIQFFKSIPKFLEYDKELKAFPEYYNHPSVATGNIKFLRKTYGMTIPLRGFILRIRNISFLSRIINFAKDLISKGS